MNNFKSGKPGGQRNKPKFIGGRPREDANYGAKKPFNKPSFGNNRDDRGGRGGGDRRDVQMFSATCADCGKACQVPFKPDGSKPVRCSECFGKNKDQGSFGAGRERGSFDRGDRKPERRNDAPRPERDPSPDMAALKEQVSGLESKLNEILKLLKGTSSPQAPVHEGEVRVIKPIKTATKKVAAKKVVAKKAPAKKVVKKAAKKTVK